MQKSATARATGSKNDNVRGTGICFLYSQCCRFYRKFRQSSSVKLASRRFSTSHHYEELKIRYDTSDTITFNVRSKTDEYSQLSLPHVAKTENKRKEKLKINKNRLMQGPEVREISPVGSAGLRLWRPWCTQKK